ILINFIKGMPGLIVHSSLQGAIYYYWIVEYCCKLSPYHINLADINWQILNINRKGLIYVGDNRYRKKVSFWL
ncbi:hypothetical protein, partial [Thiospirillum jenense]|uniref:hypothetical protein n=1 Tax=Thiospirillum jenense TaxID=1653858 RepID=UPI001EEBABF1